MIFKQEIEKLVESNLNIYLENSDRFVADFNRELELTKEYNGRQLLELLQNADDAGSKEVEIIWNKNNAIITVSNTGEPFSLGGIKSLMIANLSTKTKINYIGSKGLGFRSILNWAEEINIHGNGCKVSFSEAIAKEVFNNKLKLTDNEIANIRKDRDLSNSSVPFPILAVPIVTVDVNKSHWTTTIEIKCKKKYIIDIEKQLSELREEILLFLNFIEEITINKNDDYIHKLKSNKTKTESYEIVSIQEKSWKVFTRESVLPEDYQDKSKIEKQSFNLKVAFQDDLSDDYKKLFNFFPTHLSISLPCIIHGTFELSSSRNYLNESPKNEFILKELVELLKECSLYLTKDSVDWRPYKLLTPSSLNSDSKLIELFYKDLENAKKEETIYPCINNNYLRLDKIIYYNDEFDSFFQKNFPEYLQNLLIPIENQVTNQFNNFKLIQGDLVEKIEEISNTKMSIPLRAELIFHLSKIITVDEELERFSLLVNESGNVIPKENLAFTPAIRAEEKFIIPKSVKIDFMKLELYDLLISKYEKSFDKKEPKARELQRNIKSVVNLQPYDSNNVVDKIISGIRDTLNEYRNIDENISCIRDMIIVLFANFKNIENRQEKLKTRVPVISKSMQINNAEDLFLCKSYPSGELTEIIYGDSLNSNEYLADIEFWMLEKEDINIVEEFFIWLGINKFSKILSVDLQGNYSESDFLKFIFNNGTDKPDNFEISKIRKDSIIYKIDKFDKIINLPINNLILLVLKDSFIRKQLESNDERINWFYVNWRPSIVSIYSYLRYQFIQSNIFTKYILKDGSEELNTLINDNFEIDYEFLKKYDIDKVEVKAILIKLGAKESFDEISPEQIYSIIKSIPERDSNKKGRSTQTIYKLALDSLESQNSEYPVPTDLILFSKIGDKEEYQSAQNIYYSNNKILPNKILDKIYLLNLPKRSGEEKVKRFFNVKSLKDFKIQINENSIEYSPIDGDFNKLFESIKPYLLASRLEALDKKRKVSESEMKQAEAEANLIKQCRIHIVIDCSYNFMDNVDASIEEKEYINVRDDYYYRDSTISSIEKIKMDSIFCDAFAEMMCIVFKVDDLKNEFRQIFKNDLQDTIHLKTLDLGKDKLNRVYELLGISRTEIDFWKNIFNRKGIILQEPIDNADNLKLKIHKALGIDLTNEYRNIDFENYDNRESFELIKKLNEELLLNIKQILPKGLYNWHKSQFIKFIKDLQFKFEQILWVKLNNTPKEQSLFISTLNKYNNLYFDNIDKMMHCFNYVLKLDYSIEIRKIIKEEFEINLDENINYENMKIGNLYVVLLDKYNIEETDITDESIRSLLFFDGNKETIEEYLKSNFSIDSENMLAKSGDNSSETGFIIGALLTKNGNYTSLNVSNKYNGSWVHSGKSEKGKKQKGKKSELLVYNTLVKEHGIENVKWVSGNSTTPDKNDKLHYDIEYKNEEGDWKFLEVKTISVDQFTITYSEIEKGKSDPNKYEVALVRDNNIYVVKNLFDFKEGESVQNNSKFNAYPKDYIFSFNLENILK